MGLHLISFVGSFNFNSTNSVFLLLILGFSGSSLQTFSGNSSTCAGIFLPCSKFTHTWCIFLQTNPIISPHFSLCNSDCFFE